MAKASDNASVFLNFLNLVAAVRSLPSFPSLDATDERMLYILGLAWARDKKITVLEAMEIMPEISPSTAHRRLKLLRQKGLLTLQLDDEDNRVKYVIPTKGSNDYFSRMGQCLEKARAA